ncbi:MAG TPA: SRPBCC family protein [Acidobacteriaceae bacterium]
MIPETAGCEPVVQRSINVRASVDVAFRVFTEEMDSWWPRTHHIGGSPMSKQVVEGRVGGRLYSEHENGDEVEWGDVLAWEPPRRFVFAWMVTPDWTCERDLARCSEVEVIFTPVDNGTTLVELEHRFFSRHGEGGATMREKVSGGWGGLMEMFRSKAEVAA